MFKEALKLYLTYPAEMEYWYARPYPDDADAEEEAGVEGSRDSILLDQIAGGDKELFLDAVSQAYESALDQFTKCIVRPIGEKLRQIAQEEGLSLHHPQNRKVIAASWEWYVRTARQPNASARVTVGCSFRLRKSSESGSALYAYPWIWARSHAAAEQLNQELHGAFRFLEGNWHPNTICSDPPIRLAPDDRAKAIASEISEKLTSVLPPLSRLASGRNAVV